MEDFMMRVIGLLIVILAPIMTVYYLVYVPVHVVAESKCLEKGYPKTATDYRLNSYCMNLEGTVTVSVKALD